MADTPDNPDQTITPPTVAITDLPLEGQPATDRGYVTASGTRFRARVVTVATQETRAPTNGSATVAPSGLTLSLTLALLDDIDNVATDSAGALLITDRHEILLSDEAMKNPTFDPRAFVETCLGEQAYLLEQRMAKRAATQDYLAQFWGGAAGDTVGSVNFGLSPATATTVIDPDTGEEVTTVHDTTPVDPTPTTNPESPPAE